MKSVNSNSVRGHEREKNLDRCVYFDDKYFSMLQLCSFAHQINDIYNLKPRSILEIGIGNGFTSTYLKRAGFHVTTVDINCELGPDICVPINELEGQLQEKNFDLVVCCEVLEHMPFSEFENSIRVFRKLSSHVYLTLPNYKTFFGFGGFLKIPKIGSVLTDLIFERQSTKSLDKEHFWEVGSSKETSRKNIVKLLRDNYSRVLVKRYSLNPYHIAFKGLSDNLPLDMIKG